MLLKNLIEIKLPLNLKLDIESSSHGGKPAYVTDKRIANTQI